VNIPNAISTFRLILVPIFVVVFTFNTTESRIAAGIIFFIACVSDLADGYIARKYNQITPLGKILDPLADKLIQLAAVICLVIYAKLQVWVLVIFVLKEMLLIGGSAKMLSDNIGVLPSNFIGKMASFCFYGLLFWSIILKNFNGLVIDCLFALALVITIIAFFVYYFEYQQIVKKTRRIKCNKE